MAIEIKILGAFLENSTPNWANFRDKWAGLTVLVAPKQPLKILIFSIVMGAKYSFYVKSIAT